MKKEQVSTQNYRLEIQINETSSLLEYSLFNVTDREFPAMETTAHAELLDGFYPLYCESEEKPFGIAKTLEEAHERLRSFMDSGINRLKAYETGKRMMLPPRSVTYSKAMRRSKEIKAGINSV